MHLYPFFEIRDEAEKIRFIENRRFTNLVACSASGPVAAHLPMMPMRTEKGDLVLEGHVARSNPIAAVMEGSRALAIFNGSDAYVSAGFYPSKQVHGKVAPTWNYMAVHAEGHFELFWGADALVDHLVRLTDFLEADEPEPWAVNDAPEGFAERLVNGIVGIRIMVDSLEGIAKLNQNSRPTDQEGVIMGLRKRNIPHEQFLAEEMEKRRS